MAIMHAYNASNQLSGNCSRSIFSTTSVAAYPATERYDGLVFPDRVHRSLYTDPQVFAEEMVRIFAGSWVYLAHESEIRKPYDFKTVTVGLRPIIVTRLESGAVTAMFNRCAHRAALLCRDDGGNRRLFTCPYHGWTYDGSGELIGVPHAEGYAKSFDKGDRHLGRFPRVESYRGFIFGSLNPGVPDVVEWLGPATEYIDQWIDRGSGQRRAIELSNGKSHMPIAANWKIVGDNFADGYHVAVAHRSCNTMTTERHGSGQSLTHFRGSSSPILIKDLGNGHRLIDQRPAMGSRWVRQRPFPGKESFAELVAARTGPTQAREELEFAAYSGLNITIFPNLCLAMNDVIVIEPVSVGETRLRFSVSMPASASKEMIALRLRMGEDMVSLCTADDTEMYERCFEGLQVPEMEWYDIGRGLNTTREHVEETPAGRVTVANYNDDAGIRGAWLEWKRRMQSDFTVSVV